MRWQSPLPFNSERWPVISEYSWIVSALDWRFIRLSTSYFLPYCNEAGNWILMLAPSRGLGAPFENADGGKHSPHIPFLQQANANSRIYGTRLLHG